VSENKETGTGLTAEQLETILARVIAAVKAPTAAEQVKLEQDAARVAIDQANRLKVSGEVKQTRENKRLTQQMCSHEHSNGQTHCVWVQEPKGPGYLLCQLNQCIIRPGVASPNYKGSVIYSNELYNKIFQKLQTSMGDIIS
jgi:hypothetical protein